MAQSISPEQMQIYRATLRQRQQQRRDRQLARHQLGLQVAEQAAHLLKQDFQVAKVALFGSLLSATQVHDRSDVDLAVWGLNPCDYYRAVGRLQAIDARFSVDLVAVEDASERIQQAIAMTGVEL